SGYMAMRWNQHNRHGVKWATSEKYRLPRVQTRATAKASQSPGGPSAPAAARRQPATVAENGARALRASPASTPTWAVTASRARNTDTVRIADIGRAPPVRELYATGAKLASAAY